MHKDLMMAGAFSHSTAVGKLRKDLPDVPMDVRIKFPRYNLDEAATVCHYYVRLLANPCLLHYSPSFPFPPIPIRQPKTHFCYLKFLEKELFR